MRKELKQVIVGIALSLVALSAYAACTYNRICDASGNCQTCTMCCYGANCTTTCY